MDLCENLTQQRVGNHRNIGHSRTSVTLPCLSESKNFSASLSYRFADSHETSVGEQRQPHMESSPIFCSDNSFPSRPKKLSQHDVGKHMHDHSCSHMEEIEQDKLIPYIDLFTIVFGKESLPVSNELHQNQPQNHDASSFPTEPLGNQQESIQHEQQNVDADTAPQSNHRKRSPFLLTVRMK